MGEVCVCLGLWPVSRAVERALLAFGAAEGALRQNGALGTRGVKER